MPADIEAMFSVREMPWHRDAVVLRDYPQSFAEARVLAGLDWDPVAYPVSAEVTMTAPEVRKRALAIVRDSATSSVTDTTDRFMSLWEESFRQPASPEATRLLTTLGARTVSAESEDDWYRIARSDTGRTLSYQRGSYNVIPNSAFGAIMDAIIGAGEKGNVQLETGGCLSGGRKVWMLARLNEPHQVQARGRIDQSYSFPFLGVTSDHTGKASCAARLTMVRIVCGNTFKLSEAEGERTGAVFTFNHRGDWRDRLDEARDALQFARKERQQYAEAMSDLLSVTVTPAQEQAWLREFLPAPPTITDRAMANVEDARAAVMGFLDSMTVEGSGIRGTAYGLVQAAGEFADHGRRSLGWESKFKRSMLQAEPLKARAALLAREAAKLL